MKRVFSFLASVITVLIISSSCITCFAAQLGDVNNDGKHSLVDAKLVLKSVAGLVELDSVQARLGDVNNDGKISIADAKLILQIIVGIKEPPSSAVYPELEAIISDAQAIDQSYYTEETVAVLNEAVAAGVAVSVLPDADKQQVESAIVNIENALNSLKSYRQRLAEVVVLAESVDTIGCEESTVKALTNSIQTAKNLLANENASVRGIKTVCGRLENLLNNIEVYKQELSVSKQNLADSIKSASEIDLTQPRNGSEYTAESVSELKTAIANAQTVYSNPASTKTEVESVAEKLETAVSLLRTYKELLRNHIKAAQKVYQEELLAGSPDLKTEINRVALIYNDASSTDEDYIKAMNELSAAVKEFTDYYNKHTNQGVIDW